MYPPSQTLNLDIEAISGIAGSISIACWIVVFSPQIIETFKRGNADALSIRFIVIWALGDVFNVVGGILQGVLPTMIILAIYYLLADIVLLWQCFYYKGFTWHDDVPSPTPINKPTTPNLGEASETTGLLHPPPGPERRASGVSVEHLSPAVPLIDSSSPRKENQKPTTRLQATLFNFVVILMVCIAGVLGWFISQHSLSNTHPSPPSDPSSSEGDVEFSLWGQIFGYICAALYLGSRLPQIHRNYLRKSCEGISALFFIFACIGNVTYVLSIFAYEAKCDGKCKEGEAASLYGRYIAVNASWLAGSLGCVLLDLVTLTQFVVYGEGREEGGDGERGENGDANGSANGRGREVDRPLLEREDSGYQ